MTTVTGFRQYKEHLYNSIITLILFTKSASKIVSVNVVFHEKQRAIKFFRYIFPKWFRSNTEQFLLHGRIVVSSVCYTEPTDNLL